jgi:hypothetical protein
MNVIYAHELDPSQPKAGYWYLPTYVPREAIMTIYGAEYFGCITYTCKSCVWRMFVMITIFGDFAIIKITKHLEHTQMYNARINFWI